MKRYQLITRQEWQKIEADKQQRHIDRFWQSSSIRAMMDNNSIPEQRRVKYFYASEYDEVIQFCVSHTEQCLNLFITLEKLGLYHGRDLYNNDSARVTAALKTAITSERAVLIELPQVYSSGFLPPSLPKRQSMITPEVNKIGSYDPRDFLKQVHADEENWIELEVNNLPNQPFTLFHSTTDKVIYTGTLDENGYAYVKLPLGVKYVDVLFDHQKEKRAWYYDVPLQVVGGVRDAGQSTLDLIFEFVQKGILLGRFDDYVNPNQIAFEWLTNDKSLAETIADQYRFIYVNLDKFSNPIELPQVAQADTAAGAMIRGVSQFLTDFIPAFKFAKFLKPLGRFGKYSRGMVAGIVADVAAFGPNEERLSNLIQEYPELSNPITEYLAANPDDSAAEGRFKNAVEGLLAGALTDVLLKSLRVFKYAHFKSLYAEIRTKTKYRLEAIYPDGIHFNVVQKVHLATVESFTQRLGIKGGHNANAFYEAVSQYNIKIISETPTGIKGITQVIYQIPARDRANNIIPGEFKKESFTKTIYDPEVYSDQIILEYGQRAVATGYEDAMMAGAREYDIIIEGIPFHAYLNTKTGLVENFFPMVK